MDLAGRVAIITGASSGIGAACAREFHRRGARLLLTARSATRLAEAATQTGAATVVGDITSPAIQAEVVETALARYGQIDVLVNNAGAGLYAPSHTAPLETARQMFELNLFAPLALVQLTAPHMKRQHGGMIVNISSVAGLVPLPWFTMYSASKFALSAMTAGQRLELARHNIRSLAVCPGYVRTGFPDNVLAGDPPKQHWRDRRFSISADECAQAIARGIEREKRTVVTPRLGWALVWAHHLAPSLVDHFLQGMNERLAATRPE